MTMSKKNETVLDGSPVEASKENKQPTVYDDLLKNGTAILEAPTREALAELVDNIPADCKYAVGAVGRKGDGSAYTIRVDIVK
jgi:hypothetical protein